MLAEIFSPDILIVLGALLCVGVVACVLVALIVVLVRGGKKS
jgi:hypothetical protein